MLIYIYIEYGGLAFLQELVDNLMVNSDSNIRKFICFILSKVQNYAALRKNDYPILLDYDTHVHVFTMMASKSSPAVLFDGFSILLTMINNTHSVKQVITDGMIDCIELQINQIHLAQLEKYDKISEEYFLKLYAIISFINEVSRDYYYFDIHQIITFTITVKIFEYINQSEELKEKLIEEMLGFIGNIFRSNLSETEYIIFGLFVNNNGKLLDMILDYIKYESVYIRWMSLSVLIHGISHYNKEWIPSIIHQNIIHIIDYLIQSIELQNHDILLINKILSKIMDTTNVNYHAILDHEEIITFIINCLEAQDESQYIFASKLITRILSSTDTLVIKKLLNFKQGIVLDAVTTVISNFKLSYQDPFIELFKYRLFQHLKEMVIMQYVDEKYLKNKLNQFNFVQSFIKSNIVVIDAHNHQQTFSKDVLKILKYDYDDYRNDFDDRRFDIIFLISMCQTSN